MPTFIKQLFPTIWHFAVAAVVGVAISAAIYLGLLQRHFFSWRYLTYAVLILFAGTLIVAWLNRKFAIDCLKNYSKKMQAFAVIISVAASLMMMLQTEVQPLYYILPDTELSIQFSIPELPEGEEGVRLLWVKTGQGFVHYTRMTVAGQWERIFGNTIFPPNQDVSITWRGKVGQKAEIAFRHTEYDQPITVSWDGKTQTYNLNKPKEPDILIRSRFQTPIICLLPFTWSFLIAVGYAMFVLLLFLSKWEPFEHKRTLLGTRAWLLYMLPMLIAWGFVLAVFWPGVMSNDSLAQWYQGVNGQFNDWQSGFHALLLAGLMRVWYSPAIVAILQVLFFSLVVAWGLGTLQDHGAPRIALWGLSILFAILPTNGLLAVTIWKDVSYAIAFLWLTIIIIKNGLEKGEWVGRGINWISLGLAAFLVSIFRHNGVAVAAGSMLVLLIVYRKTWKPYLGAILVGVLLYVSVKGPLYSAAKMDRASTGQTNLIYLHHLAAHLYEGTLFKPEETAYLDNFMPVDNWDYWCCYVGTISYNGQFERQTFLANTAQNRNLALTLFTRDPLVDISHAFCAGEMAWKFENNECYMKSTHGISTWRPGKVVWIGKNDFNLVQKSFLPEIVDAFVLYLRNFGFLDDMLVFWLRPAFWLYIGVFCAAVLVMRRNDARYLLALLPSISQTVVLILVSFAPAFRYYYGTFLAGLFLLGLMFIPGKSDSF